MRSRTLIGQGPDRRGTKHGALFGLVADQAIGHFAHVLAAKHAHQRVDVGPLGQQIFFLPFGQAARHDHAVGLAVAFELQHLVDGGIRFGSRLFDEPAGVDHDEVGSLRVD